MAKIIKIERRNNMPAVDLNQTPVMDVNAIMEMLPHRPPFLMLDKVFELSPNHVIGSKNVTMNESFFQGHFPGVPVMPGVFIIEALAQTAAVMVGVSMGLADKNLLIYFMGIDNCKFRRKVGPGETLELRVSVLRGKIGSKVWKFSGIASVAGETAAEVEFTAMMELPPGV